MSTNLKSACLGIEIEPGVFSGCKPFRCPTCKGATVINWWHVECPTCCGRGEVKDCAVCCEGRLHPANVIGLPALEHGR